MNAVLCFLVACAVAAAQPYVTLVAPPMGTADAFSGTAHNLGRATTSVKGILLVSADNVNWWDKMHSRYLVGVPVANPGTAQNQGIPLAADGSFTWDKVRDVWADERRAHDVRAREMTSCDRGLFLPTRALLRHVAALASRAPRSPRPPSTVLAVVRALWDRGIRASEDRCPGLQLVGKSAGRGPPRY